MEIISVDNRGNKIVGNSPVFVDSTLNFEGENNILYCDENVRLNKSVLNFKGNNSLIYLGKGEHKIEVFIFNNSVFHCGRLNVYTDIMRFYVGERKHCFIGDNGIISFGVLARTSDPHMIYSCKNGNRINMSESIYIGDHVWIGQDVTILKGTQIDSGSIVGASSVVAGKKISHNSIWAGIPVKQIKRDVFWERTSVHDFTEEMTEDSMNYTEFSNKYREGYHDDFWIYEYDKEQEVSWSYLEEALSRGTAMEKCVFLKEFNSNKAKNRFVHALENR